MADAPVVHIGENSPEYVAYMLAREVLITIEGRKWRDMDRETYLDTYAECFAAAKGYRTHKG